MPLALTASVKSSSVTVGGLTSDPSFTATNIVVTLKDPSGKAVLTNTFPRTDMTGDTAVLNLNQTLAAPGVALENALPDGTALATSVKAIDKDNNASPEATAPEPHTITPQDRLAIMAYQGTAQRLGGTSGNTDQERREREQRDRESEARRQQRLEQSSKERRAATDAVSVMAKHIADGNSIQRQVLDEVRKQRPADLTGLQQHMADSTRVQKDLVTGNKDLLASHKDLLAELRRQSHAGGSGGGGNMNQPAPTPIVVKSGDKVNWTVVVILTIIFLILMAGGTVYVTIYLRQTPAVAPVQNIRIIGMNAGGQVNPAPVRQIPPIKELKSMTIVETTTASNSAPTAGTVEKHKLSTVGDDDLQPQTASKKTACLASYPAQREVVTQYTAPVYIERQEWGSQGSVSLQYHLGSSRRDYPARTQVACTPPPIDVVRVHTQRGSGDVLASNPAFGVSRDLVIYGNTYREVPRKDRPASAPAVQHTVIASTNIGNHGAFKSNRH